MTTILAIDTKTSKKGTAYNLLTVKASDGSIGRVFDFSGEPRFVGDTITLEVTFDRNLNPRVRVK